MLCIDSARKAEKAWPRMAASEEGKIGRLRRRLRPAEEVLDLEQIAIAQHCLERVTFALVRRTKIPSKRAPRQAFQRITMSARPGSGFAQIAP